MQVFVKRKSVILLDRTLRKIFPSTLRREMGLNCYSLVEFSFLGIQAPSACLHWFATVPFLQITKNSEDLWAAFVHIVGYTTWPQMVLNLVIGNGISGRVLKGLSSCSLSGSLKLLCKKLSTSSFEQARWPLCFCTKGCFVNLNKLDTKRSTFWLFLPLLLCHSALQRVNRFFLMVLRSSAGVVSPPQQLT